jgi:hypothetical protein
MDDRTNKDLRIRLLILLLLLSGVLAFFIGLLIPVYELSVIGVFLIGMPILLYVGYLMVEAQRDEGMVIEASQRAFRPAGIGPPGEGVLQEGPGTCPACGGTLFYGRVNCPHCSVSIFLDAGESPPPEL